MNKKLALVTVLYKSSEVLDRFLEALSKQKYNDWFIYVIDNNEDNLDYEKFNELAYKYSIKNFEYIANHKNLGVSKGNNQGILKSLAERYEYTLLLNNDIYFDEDCLGKTVEYADLNKVNALVPKIYYAGTNKLWMTGGKISKFTGTTSHRGEFDEDEGQYNQKEIVEYAPTCYMLIKNCVFEDIGIMDEKFFVYYDDTDFVFRMNKAGYRIIYDPSLIVHHMVSFSTGGSESNFTIYQGTKNRIVFIRKNFNSFNKFLSFSFFFSTRVIKYFKYNAMQRKNMLKAIHDGWNVNL